MLVITCSQAASHFGTVAILLFSISSSNIFAECEKQLENQFEQELEDAKKACESDSMPHAHSFSRKVTETADMCKDIADQKIKLATQTYKRVSDLVHCAKFGATEGEGTFA